MTRVAHVHGHLGEVGFSMRLGGGGGSPEPLKEEGASRKGLS